jgi:hypothetical protein
MSTSVPLVGMNDVQTISPHEKKCNKSDAQDYDFSYRYYNFYFKFYFHTLIYAWGTLRGVFCVRGRRALAEKK